MRAWARLRALGAAGALVGVCQPAAAADLASDSFTRLFFDACVPSMGHPEQVRAWAAAHRLAEVTDPALLKLFVGDGDGGAAWTVRTASGQFAVSLRGKTHGCSVWARTADPAEVRARFEQLLEGVRRPGVLVAKVKDSHDPTPFGDYRVLAYDVTTPGAQGSFVFILQTVERPGGAFQAWAEVAAARSG